MRPETKWAEFLSDQRGAATIEFTIIFPFLMYMILSIAEAGSLMARAVMLDRGVEIAMRDLRLGRVPGITHQEIKDRICDAAFLIGKCRGAIQLELAPLPSSASFPEAGITCIDRTSEIQPVVVFDPGARSEIMLVRACVVVDPIFPGIGLGALLPTDASGGVALTALSAFMNEPG